MAVIGITGGIATGKSSFVRALLRQLPGELFDADAEARQLMSNPDVRAELRSQFGEEVFEPDGAPNRRRLRELVFADERHRRRLESILHPRIRQAWTQRAAGLKGSSDFYYVDIPLLFETEAGPYFDRIVVVACSSSTQQQRLREQRGLAADLAKRIICAQLDLGTKITKADHLIWNDSTVSCLDGQATLLGAILRHYYA